MNATHNELYINKNVCGKPPAWCKGKKLSEEHRNNISKSKQGKKREPFSIEWKEKIGAGCRGKKRSKETKDRMRDVNRARNRSNYKNRNVNWYIQDPDGTIKHYDFLMDWAKKYFPEKPTNASQTIVKRGHYKKYRGWKS